MSAIDTRQSKDQVLSNKESKLIQDTNSSYFAYGLRPDVLGRFETLAQSISCLAPTATPAILIPLVFASAGNSTWLVYILATIAIVLVAANVNQFASRSASPGSIYTYVAIGLGPGMGLLTGWLLLFAYIIVISCLEAEVALYGVPFVKTLFHASIEPIFFMVLCSSIAAYITWRDIKLSASLMLILEFCSITLILLLMGITIFHHHGIIDWPQIHLAGVTTHGFIMGLVFGILGYTGFESAASLGSEAKNPLKSIPQAIMHSGLWSGVFYALCSYIMIMGFAASTQKLNGSGAPLINLASINGVPFLGMLLSLGALISFFACTLSCIITGSRLIFMMGHHGLLHSSLGQSHESNQTPHIAILFATIIGGIPAIIMSLCHCGMVDIITWTGTISAYSFITSYALVSIAASAYLYQLKSLRWQEVLVSFLAVIMMLLALVGNVDPKATGINQFLPHMFLVLLIIGAVWYLYLKVFSPATIKLMTDDMEAIRARFLQG